MTLFQVRRFPSSSFHKYFNNNLTLHCRAVLAVGVRPNLHHHLKAKADVDPEVSVVSDLAEHSSYPTIVVH